MKEKVVLAYSGGLDTTALIPWLKETFDYDVVCCCVNCGQGNELDGLEERAKLSGASKLYIEDIVDDFCDNYIMPCVLDKDVCPQTKWVEGSNYVDVNFKIDPRTHRIIMMGAIDNLVKGAAGQAVQNMNLMFGFDEAEGLLQVPMYP